MSIIVGVLCCRNVMLPDSNSAPSTPLKASERKQQQRLNLRKQARFRSIGLLFIVFITWLLDISYFKSGLQYTKSIVIGATLNWLSQAIFASFIFKYSGAIQTRGVVNQLYVGQLVKWLILIIGFSIVFMSPYRISAGAVISGFIMMQICYFISLWLVRIKY